MARQQGASVENNFIRGLITEATGLNFPDSACTDALNTRFSQTGEVSRREGFDFESNHVNLTAARTSSVISEYFWEAVAGTGNINFVVVQIGRIIYFYRVEVSEPLSVGIQFFEIDLNDFLASGAPNPKLAGCQFASGKGYLFVSHPYCNPFYVSYDVDTENITSTQIDIKIRDFEGVEDNLDAEEHPTTLSNEHHYNLWNQGWYTTVLVAHEGGDVAEPIGRFFDQESEYPSNCDIWWAYKDEQNAFRPKDMFKAFGVGNTPAPKGHYILDAFYQDRSAQEGIELSGTALSTIPGLAVVSSGYFRPTTIGFYAGRVWYAGVNSSGFSSKIYYSQIIDDIKKVGRCYQANDPTAENLSDLLDTDGGVIEIQEIGNIIKVFAMRSAFLIFASNGVWAISGTQDSGFKATDFQINKLSSVPTISSSSFISVSGVPLWWNNDGIYTVATAQTGQLDLQNVTDKTVKSFYADIPTVSKQYAKGAYNTLTKEVQWIYSSVAGTTTDENYNYDSVLCLNTLTGAFYPFEIDDSLIAINGIVAVQGQGSQLVDVDIVDNSGNQVVSAASDIVVIQDVTQESFSSVFKYLSTVPAGGINYRFTWSEEKDTTYKDWKTLSGDGFDYTSSFVTNYKLSGNALMKAQTPWIVIFSRTATSSSCFLQVIWDFANSTASGRWGRWNQIYPAVNNYDFQQRRIKLRGSGRAAQLHFFSESGKPFFVIGWSNLELVNQVV